MTGRSVRRDCRCDCGHQKMHHFLAIGCCRYCGCTWFWRNIRATLARRAALLTSAVGKPQ